MKLIQRIGYYLGGFSLGLIILAFFLNGKKTSCSYGLDARVLKNISSKKIIYNDDAAVYVKNNALDTSNIRRAIKKGDVNFSKSNTRQKPCGLYVIEANMNEKDIIFNITNCDSIATITSIK
ncbi:hypothetical protein [uncultured Algibacter sp.]|uniref:hypothetical protein n=1 Tax=uncultured Algibacter sp. TaxID=298659 RepID=UPI003216819F